MRGTAGKEPMMAKQQDAERERLARRYVWWREPEATLIDLPRLLCQIMAVGTARDYISARHIWGEAAFKDALGGALPGAMDGRSWAYWHRHYKLPRRPMPTRCFNEAAS
jgi:hypothetical protein